MVQNGVLSNRAPSGKNRTALSITADGQPEQAVYLKGFIGAIYQGTYWEEISDENFRRLWMSIISMDWLLPTMKK